MLNEPLHMPASGTGLLTRQPVKAANPDSRYNYRIHAGYK